MGESKAMETFVPPAFEWNRIDGCFSDFVTINRSKISNLLFDLGLREHPLIEEDEDSETQWLDFLCTDHNASEICCLLLNHLMATNYKINGKDILPTDINGVLALMGADWITRSMFWPKYHTKLGVANDVGLKQPNDHHIFHSLMVLLIGDMLIFGDRNRYILQLIKNTLRRIGESLKIEVPYDDENFIRFTWHIIALFHDIGYIHSSFYSLCILFNNVENATGFICNSYRFNELPNLKESVGKLFCHVDSKEVIHPYLHGEETSFSHKCHQAWSSLNLSLLNQETIKQGNQVLLPFAIACQTIMYHHCFAHVWHLAGRKPSMDESPFLYLLAIVDSIQSVPRIETHIANRDKIVNCIIDDSIDIRVTRIDETIKFESRIERSVEDRLQKLNGNKADYDEMSIGIKSIRKAIEQDARNVLALNKSLSSDKLAFILTSNNLEQLFKALKKKTIALPTNDGYFFKEMQPQYKARFATSLNYLLEIEPFDLDILEKIMAKNGHARYEEFYGQFISDIEKKKNENKINLNYAYVIDIESRYKWQWANLLAKNLAQFYIKNLKKILLF